MTPEAKDDKLQTADDLHTTIPNNRADEWTMPAPVFQKTSGRLPESFAKDRQQTTAVDPSPAETDDAADPNALTGTGPKSPVLKIVLIALAMAAMIAFIAVFLTAVYFFFLRSNGSD